MSTSSLEWRRWLPAAGHAQLWQRVLVTPADPASAVARIALGAMILPHGMQKALGWFGGAGFEGAMTFFTETMGMPWLVSVSVVGAEFLGGLALLVGLGGRIAAAGVGAVMVGAALTTHVQHGFFMNWFGALPAGSEGWEFHLLATALAAIVVIRGSGSISLDRLLAGPDDSSGLRVR
ncbi:MAG: DoxX family membrane protein [Gemmatimonadetes bacterium]|nr:DoxX family protein [Gemmatimonadota bacterium]NIR78290.1 DoxX family protein [Gemmatimonadota bacterium]NIT86876.1 DoxX family protein [Gemmatimonadota bacterium]NIU31222.1 DoxX family protein [Gemmatimonadota bacterium]NIU35532.1 DoxX family membrane protein [Gemmatimonadota bacterium]